MEAEHGWGRAPRRDRGPHRRHDPVGGAEGLRLVTLNRAIRGGTSLSPWRRSAASRSPPRARLPRVRLLSILGEMQDSVIVVAGATGSLGGRITRALVERGASVRALVRHETPRDRLEVLQKLGVTIAGVDLRSPAGSTAACTGASCVVSALQGLQDVIVDAQVALLHAAVKAGVPRFIPSDYSIDFTKLPSGQNRNLDLRREFHRHLAQAPISATTVFNGAFADMLNGQMPLILFRWRRVLYWGSADQRMDFTTIDDTAAFTARAALDPSTPRFLRIAGDQLSARELASVTSEVTGERFRPFRAGGLGTLGMLTKIAHTFAPGGDEVFPAWQGMQYMHNMFEGRAKLDPLDNDRYPGIRWTTAREVIASRRPGG
ncbi:MAG TPA: NmrA family NAD(P)-binding protein [Anaeromyxobacter sp.]|nr:NmrA family NAD(P)-binding protein [Anaeromyxobacter sp.]